MILRPYQNLCVSDLRSGFREHKRQILCSPTGSGKTVMFSYMAFNSLQKSNKVAILTDRVELCKQSYKAISHHTNDFEILTSGANISRNPKGLIAMVETLNNRLKNGWTWEPDLLIIDEAHKGNFSKVLDQWKDPFTIGATATPIGKHFYKYYTNIVAPVNIPDLINDGWLVPCRAYQKQDDFADLVVSHGEFTENSLFNHFNKPDLYGGVIDGWREKAFGMKTLVFCVNVKHAENTYQEFVRAGISARVLTSKTSKFEREQILQDYEEGKFAVLVNCGILTTGFDDPSIECIIVNRATNSLILWLQMCGRGSRIFPGKKEFIVLDFGMNHNRHGLWSAEREWKIEKPGKKRPGAPPVKICPKCEAMVPASAKKCDWCQYIFPLKNKKLKDGVFVEMKDEPIKTGLNKKLSEMTLKELYKLQLTKRFKANFIWRIVRSRGPQAIFTYSIIASYNTGWIRKQEEQINNSKFTDILVK